MATVRNKAGGGRVDPHITHPKRFAAANPYSGFKNEYLPINFPGWDAIHEEEEEVVLPPWYEGAAYADLAAVADFNNDQYAITEVTLANVPTATAAELKVKRSATFAEWFAFVTTGTTSRTYTDASGVLKNDLAANQPRFTYINGKRQLRLENAGTNLILNSATVATQSVTVTATAYTLSFTGTGSITYSGTASGTLNGTGVNNRVKSTFTPTAGSLTLTVTGDVRMGQLETGSFATDYIPTTSSAVTRPIETARMSPLIEAILQRSAGSVVVRGRMDAGQTASGPRIVGGPSSGAVGFLGRSGSNLFTWSGSSLLQIAMGSNWDTSPFGIAFAFNAAGRVITGNGLTPVSDANAIGSRSEVYLGRGGHLVVSNEGYAHGHYDFVGISPERLSNAALQALAVAA